MRITFWGTRGSIPSPGPETVRYGGNTSCVAVETSEGRTIILDAGSGIRGLGLTLAKKMPVSCSIFLSHTHWDHIQGLPFFVPLFVPGNEVDIHGTFDPILMKDIKEVLSVQMEYYYFPIRSAELKAKVAYKTLREGQRVDVGEARVTAILMNHTVLSFGYKVESGGKTLFYTGDHEDYANIYEPGEAYYQEYETLIAQKRKHLVGFMRGVDVLVADAQYTAEEYPAKTGWGHSSPDRYVDMAVEAGVKSIYFTHHEPTRDDDAVDRFLTDILAKHGDRGVAIAMAAEGLSIDL